MCRVLRVAPSGFYAWIHRPLSARAKEDGRLLPLVRASHTASGGIYGSPRIFLDLKETGETCGRHRVARIMQENKLRGVQGYKVPRAVVGGPPALLAPNRLNRQFTVHEPDTAWVTDITYIRTWQGWLYLSVVMDLYARRIVGWSTKPSLARELVLDAIVMAVWRRRPGAGLIIHSDQGSQYGSDEFQRFCRAHHLKPSMSRWANCWDNAVAESFFSSLKKERVRKRIYRTGSTPLARTLQRRSISDQEECHGKAKEVQ
jgi:putative transposase